MPYISADERPHLDVVIEPVIASLTGKYPTPEKVLGPLNYVLTRVTMGVLRNLAENPKFRGYSTLAGFAGVISHVGTEIYRRYTALYEDAKIAANGDLKDFES